MATTWRTEARPYVWQIYAANPELDAWRSEQLMLLADDPSNPKMPANPLSEWDAHVDGMRAFREIIRRAQAARDAKTDRLLAKRTDALGELFNRAPKRERKTK